jgi:hypothetical protein
MQVGPCTGPCAFQPPERTTTGHGRLQRLANCPVPTGGDGGRARGGVLPLRQYRVAPATVRGWLDPGCSCRGVARLGKGPPWGISPTLHKEHWRHRRERRGTTHLDTILVIYGLHGDLPAKRRAAKLSGIQGCSAAGPAAKRP